MTEIPADVMKAAREALLSNKPVNAIARAIMAERERAAKVVEAWDGYAEYAAIAAAIRGDQP